MTPDPSASAFHAFISHAGEQAPLAQELSDRLARYGLKCYAYKRDGRPGEDYLVREAEIIKSSAFILLVSRDAAAEGGGYREILFEIQTAIENNRNIIPVFLDTALASDSDIKLQLLIPKKSGLILGNGLVDTPTIERLAKAVRDELGWGSAIDNDVYGRDHAAREIAAHIVSLNRRVYIIYGPPGAGKSTVAALVQKLLFGEGWTIGAVSLSRDDTSFAQVVTRIMNDLAIDVDAGASTDEMLRLLRQRVSAANRFLLYVDNFEQVSSESEAQFIEWCKRVAELKVLITSRVFRCAAVSGVVGRSLEPLPVPSEKEIQSLTPAALEQAYSVVQLFLDRVQDVRAAEPLSDVRAALQREPDTIREIARLCALLGGFPAPVDQAAKNFGRFGRLQRYVSEARKYRQSLRVGASSAETMEVAVRSTLATLPESTKRAFLLLSQFRGSFDDTAAESVLDGVGNPYELMVGLHESGLLRAERSSRWSMYLPCQEVGDAIMAERVDGVDVRRAFDNGHQRAFVSKARALHTSLQTTSKGVARLELLQEAHADVHNYRVALRRACSASDSGQALGVLKALVPVYMRYGPASELQELAEEVAVASKNPTDAVRAYVEAATAAELLGRYKSAGAYIKAAELLVPSEDLQLRLMVLARLRMSAEHAGEGETLDRVHRELIELLERLEGGPDPGALCVSLIEAAYSSELVDGFESGARFARRALEIARNRDIDPFLSWRARACLGILLWRDARLDEALSVHQEGLTWIDQQLAAGSEGSLLTAKGGALTNIGLVYIDLGQCDEAFRVLGESYPLTKGNEAFGAVNRTALIMATLYQGGIGRTAQRATNASKAIALADEHQQLVMGTEYGQTIALFLQVKGEAQYWCGDVRAAETTLQAARAWSRRSNIRALERDFAICVLLARIASEDGRQKEARIFIEDASEFVRIRGLGDRDWPIERTRSRYVDYLRLRSSLGVESK
ncbi:MAG: TIR domain-containing protein [Phycisphaeraceae bacterium]|nr:TIR domain-containing protein [Phycisphaeraceae bacterium]